MKTEAKTEKVVVKIPNVRGSGRREGWLRTVSGFDEAERGARHFVGEYLKPGTEEILPVGQIVISVEPEGSASQGTNAAYLAVIDKDGDLAYFNAEKPYHWRNQFPSFAKYVREKFDSHTASPDRSNAAELASDALLHAAQVAQDNEQPVRCAYFRKLAKMTSSAPQD